MNTLEDALYKTQGKYQDNIEGCDKCNDSVKAITKAWDEVQESLKCCGTYLNGTDTDGRNSWIESGAYPVTVSGKKYNVPASCCGTYLNGTDTDGRNSWIE